MATAETTKGPDSDADQIRERWLERLNDLISAVRSWADEMDWATRDIEVNMKDSVLGKYKAPALLLQEGKARLILEPIARSTIGSEGLVDLYLMPGYDDVANLFYHDRGWQLHYAFSERTIVETLAEAEHKPLTRESLREVLEDLVRHVG